MQLVLAITALARNKVVALKLGPSAFGELAQIAAIFSVITTLVSFGMAIGLSRNVAKARTIDERQHQLENANAIVLGLAVVAVSTTLLLLSTGRLLPLAALEQTPVVIFTAALFIAAIPIEALKNNYLALLQGILDVRGLAVRRSLAVLVATAVAIPIVWFFGFTGAAIQFLVISALVTAILGWRCRALGYSPLRVRVDRRVAPLLVSFGIMSMASGFAQTFADTSVRALLIDSAGASANGVLQAAYVLSESLKGIILTSIGSVSLATVASTTDKTQMTIALDRLLNVIVPLGSSALALLGLLGVPTLALLYSRAFVAGASLFPYLLCADLLLMFVWVVGAPLLAFGDRVLWLMLDLVYAAVRWGVAVVLMRHLSGLAVVIGYLGAVAVHLVLNLSVCRFRYGLALNGVHLRRLAVGLALVGLLSTVGAAWTRSGPAMAAAAVLWMGYSFHHMWRLGLVAALKARLQRG